MISRLATLDAAGVTTVDAAADELGLSRRQVYVLLGRWRTGGGVVSDLLPGRSSGGRGGSRLPDDVEAIVRQVLQARYLTRQRRSVAAVCREISRLCRVRGLQVPSRGTVLHGSSAGWLMHLIKTPRTSGTDDETISVVVQPPGVSGASRK